MYSESIKVYYRNAISLDRSLIRYIIKLATNVDPSFTFVHSALKGNIFRKWIREVKRRAILLARGGEI